MQNFYFFCIERNIPQIVLANINNIPCRDFIVSSKKMMFQRVTSRCKKYDADCTMTPLATKNRRSICTRATDSKFFDKLSRAISVKHTSYNWRNAEATYLVLLTGYSSFDIRKNLFNCKSYFAWCKISVCFSFFVICTIADSSKVLIQIKNFS